MSRHPNILDIFGEHVCRPFPPAKREADVMDLVVEEKQEESGMPFWPGVLLVGEEIGCISSVILLYTIRALR